MPIRKIVLVVLAVAALASCTKKAGRDWVEIGEGPDYGSIPYRTINLEANDKRPAFPVTNPDLTSLTLGLQSGKYRDTWVYIQLFDCYAPKLRSGLPSVLCTSINGSDVFIVSNDTVREYLLSIEKKEKIAAIIGRAIGLHADTPVVVIKQEITEKDKAALK
ncbi:hypothetical protein [Undibacterium sp. Ji42W]|uniref:hypothetical protein n=1 Tax=Undibacterium sp. Ji42W TaxID=3413039 RepID=UPI003BF4EEF8